MVPHHTIYVNTLDPKSLKMDKILDFYDSGHNIIIAGDVDTSKYFRSLVTNFGVDFHPYVNRIAQISDNLGIKGL